MEIKETKSQTRKEAIKKAVLDNERLKEVLTYDEDTGIFRWRKALSTCVKEGEIAGWINEKGYHLIQVDGISYHAHRLAWLYVHGRFPENQIDHINGNKGDNRIKNLRDVTNRANHQNQARHRNGKLVGMHWHKDRKKWCAQIWVDGKLAHLGYYRTEQEAHEAYVEALAELGPCRPQVGTRSRI